jgi:type VI secretion system FHA domain protein
MPISVTVRNLQADGPAWQVVLPEPVATIGRQASCDVVLHEPGKYVSRLHATVELRADGHYLVVNSKTNPVLVDSARFPPDTACALRDGTVIRMHPFEVTVHIERAGSSRAASPSGGADSFAWLGQREPAAAIADPFGLYPAPSPALPPAGPVLASFLQAAPQPSSQLAADLDSALAPGAPPSLDPLVLLGGAAAGTHAGGVDALLGGDGIGGTHAPLVDFGGRQRDSGAAALDHVHDFKLPFNAASGPALALVPATVSAHDHPGFDWLDQVTRVAASTPDAPVSSIDAEPAASPPAAVPASPAAPGAAAVASFLRGMGAPPFDIAPGQENEFFENAGKIVEAAVRAMVELLRARGEIKKELRAQERTMLGTCANNPLKFMGNAEEALRFMFDPAAPNAAAFLSPTMAIEEACGELVAHEMGLMAGMRAAVAGALEYFDPEAVELRACKPGGLIAMQRNARLWQAYEKQYARLRTDMADNVDQLFEREFQAAYTEQVRRVARKQSA